MEYFHFSESVDLDEIGKAWPQAVFKNPKKLEPNPVLLANKAINGTFPPDDILPFDYFILQRGAKLTDLMTSSFSGSGFLMNGKLRDIFEKSNLGDYKFYDVKLYNKDKEIPDYYYFHNGCVFHQFINFEKSKFFISDMLGYYQADLNFVPKSLEELQTFSKALPNSPYRTIRPEYFFLKSNFPFNLDLFEISAFNYDFFINSRLKAKLEAEGITGLKITPVNDFIRTPNLA